MKNGIINEVAREPAAGNHWIYLQPVRKLDERKDRQPASAGEPARKHGPGRGLLQLTE